MKEILFFELKYRLKKAVTYIYFGILFLLSFGMFSLMGSSLKDVSLNLGNSGGIVFINSPYVITEIISSLSLLAVFIIAAVMHNPIFRDFQYKSQDLFFTKPITKSQYILGRFSGAFIVLMLIFTAIGFGIALANFMPWMDAEKLGPFLPNAFIGAYTFIVIPNLLFLGILFFCLASFTRNSMAAQVMAVIIFIGYLTASAISSELEHKVTASFLDPFGNSAYFLTTEYWTAADKNSITFPASAYMIYNRVIWVTVSLLIFLLFFRGFKFRSLAPAFSLKNFFRFNKEFQEKFPGLNIREKAAPTARSFTFKNYFKIMMNQTRLEFGSSVKSIYFIIIVVFGLILSLVSMSVVGSIFGTSTYPVTYMILTALSSQTIIIGIVTVFYSGELIWNERKNKIEQLIDVTPIPNWVMFSSKFLTIFLLQCVILFITLVSGIGKQIYEDYYNFEFGLYITELFGLKLINYVMLLILALFIQVLVNNKFLGYFITIVLLVLFPYFSSIGIHHEMFRFRSDFGYTYSDMNGYGHFLTSFTWYKIYWMAFSMILLLIAGIFLIRGKDTWFKIRMKIARTRASQGSFYSFGALAFLAFAASGSFIYYNQNVLNEYSTSTIENEKAVNYELIYKKYEEFLQPRIISSKVHLDLYPEKRKFMAGGIYLIENKNAEPVDSLILNISTMVDNFEVSFEKDCQLVYSDATHGVFFYRFNEPIKPGEKVKMKYYLKLNMEGFSQNDKFTSLVYNGTFLNSLMLPSLGYDNRKELEDKEERKKYKLPGKDRMASIDDEKARMNTYVASDSDWIDFEAIVSTSSDQIAIAPGYLQKEWETEGRKHFHYKMDIPILNFYSFNSAKYEVLKDSWNDINIEIFYHKGHEYNLERMVKSIKMSLEYYSENFSAYQHKQVRIIEFPRYKTFAQSFPNTIPYSESFGFIAKVESEDDVDYVFYVTAHELAHQWWAHQVIGGNVQGATMLSESLSQYGALMVMEKEYGKNYMRKFLEHELNDYLSGRGQERKKELPLMLNENQHYIHYNKGSLVFYALKEYLGEKQLNKFLQDFIKEKGFQNPPFTTSKEFVQSLKQQVPDSMQYLVSDMFEKIVLYDNKIVSAETTKLANGSFSTRVNVEFKKLEADSAGRETEVVLNDWIDIGLYDTEIKTSKPLGKELLKQRVKATGNSMEFTFETKVKPVSVSVDPYLLLVDRKIEDNSISVKD